MNVKICGLTTVEDARLALECGAWALGFVFHRPSPRYIDPERARGIVERLPKEALTVGVFVDYDLEELNRIVREARLKGAQLHGSESPAYAAGVEAGLVIKALRVGPSFDVAGMAPFAASKILLDTFHPSAPGGTGTRFDWSIARQAASLRPVIVAGGIQPENVGECVELARPEGIDVSSGVERAPGVKDPEKLRQLFREIAARAR